MWTPQGGAGADGRVAQKRPEAGRRNEQTHPGRGRGKPGDPGRAPDGRGPVPVHREESGRGARVRDGVPEGAR